MKRVSLVVVAVLVTLAAAGSVAWGKDSVKATLAPQFPLNAKPGAQVRVSWTLSYRGHDGKREPFGGQGVFVRLRSASGAASTVATATFQAGGSYAATVTVPEGGIGGVQIGIHGLSSVGGRADLLFPITNDPVHGQARLVPNASPTPTTRGSSSPWVPGLLALAAITVVAGAGILLILRLRPRHGQAAA